MNLVSIPIVFCALLAFLSRSARANLLHSPRSGRIVAGADAAVGQFPHQISLQRDDSAHICSGTILNERYILTAAHCVVAGKGKEPFPVWYFRVRVGSVQLAAGGKLLQLRRIIVHELYNFYWYDLALLELALPLVWTDKIQPIALPMLDVPDDVEVTVAGWGQVATQGRLSHRLRWSTLTTVRREACDFNDASIICLAHVGGNGMCYGDAGGAAVYGGELVGMAGYIITDCGSTFPDGFTRISYHRGWILENSRI